MDSKRRDNRLRELIYLFFYWSFYDQCFGWKKCPDFYTSNYFLTANLVQIRYTNDLEKDNFTNIFYFSNWKVNYLWIILYIWTTMLMRLVLFIHSYKRKCYRWCTTQVFYQWYISTIDDNHFIYLIQNNRIL